MVKIDSKHILILVAIFLVITVFIVVGVIFYRKGKKQVTIKEPPKDDPSGEGVNNPAGVSDSEILSIANELHTEMDGFNWSGHDVTPYQKFNALSDTDFAKVYNTFNTLYQGDSGETLRQWIESESYAFDDVIESITKKMDRLNLI